MTKKQEEAMKEMFREHLQAQFTRGMKEGAIGFVGAIYKMIQEDDGSDPQGLINQILTFCSYSLGKMDTLEEDIKK